MDKTIKEQLFLMSDEEYKKFHSKLVPNTDNILGVRLPMLKNLAKNIAKEDWRNYLLKAEDDYYEEIMLQGLVIGIAKADLDEILKYVTTFVSKINNWAICDSFCSGLKITQKHLPQMWEFLQPYLQSQKEFELRFAIVMLLDYFIRDEYIDEVLSIMDKVHHDGYYVKMAVAWTLSVCIVKYPEKTLRYFTDNNLDNFTYYKTLQKTIESYRVDNETKAKLRSMKRK